MAIIKKLASEDFVTEKIDTETTKVLNVIGLHTFLEPSDNDIPKVFFTGEMPTTKTDVLAEMTYISKTMTFHSYIKIKCQGTSSMKYPKKNYTISLFEDSDRTTKLKKDFRGWGEQSKFCLKAN